MRHMENSQTAEEFEQEWKRKIRDGIAPSPEEIVMRYAHFVSEFDLTPDQEVEFIHTFWNIMQTLVCVRLGIDPVSAAREDTKSPAARDKGSVSSSGRQRKKTAHPSGAFNGALQGSEVT